jgi:hypothetical protein
MRDTYPVMSTVFWPGVGPGILIVVVGFDERPKVMLVLRDARSTVDHSFRMEVVFELGDGEPSVRRHRRLIHRTLPSAADLVPCNPARSPKCRGIYVGVRVVTKQPPS